MENISKIELSSLRKEINCLFEDNADEIINEFLSIYKIKSLEELKTNEIDSVFRTIRKIDDITQSFRQRI